MSATLPVAVMLAPIVIAVMAVALMVLVTGGRETRGALGPRAATDELGYAVDAAEAVSLSPARYVGGHPQHQGPIGLPFVLLTPRDLAVFEKKGGSLAFALPWGKVEDLTSLTAAQMAMAASSVRGLATGALDDMAADARFVRVRFEDARGWWQNVIFELIGDHAEAQFEAIKGQWLLARAKDATAASADETAGR